ncbi:MAG: serine aminopeptidase domain-containing protein [Flavobacteriales bacterium]
MSNYARFKGGVWALATTMLCSLTGQSQITQFTHVLVDADRGDREIPVEFWHDASLTSPAALAVIAHGFAMTPADYDDLSEHLVEAGYVIGRLDTETGFAPSHLDFALDMVYVVEHAAEEVEALSGLLNDAQALVGHSMGGGAAWLAAAELGSTLEALVGLAPAETTPSAQAAGQDVEAASLVVSGTSDAITPQATQHIPLYESLTGSTCRAFVSLIEGGHCGFADAGTLCDFGEITFAGMTREEQQELSFAAVADFLSCHLDSDAQGMANLEETANQNGNVELTLACDWTGLAEVSEVGVVAPNPASSWVRVPQLGLDGGWRALDLHGRELPLRWLGSEELSIDEWPVGMVLLTWTSSSGAIVWRTSVAVVR